VGLLMKHTATPKIDALLKRTPFTASQLFEVPGDRTLLHLAEDAIAQFRNFHGSVDVGFNDPRLKAFHCALCDQHGAQYASRCVDIIQIVRTIYRFCKNNRFCETFCGDTPCPPLIRARELREKVNQQRQISETKTALRKGRHHELAG
jgi:hypothetical protein